MPPSLQTRVAALEQSVQPELGLADRLKAALDRLRAMNEQQREAYTQARLRRWRAMPKPAGGLRLSLWHAARRVAAHRGVEVPADPI